MGKRFEGGERRELRNVVQTVRRRWRLRTILRGALYSTVSVVSALVLVQLLVEAWPWGPESAAIATGVLYIGAALVTAVTLLRPIVRRVSDRQVVLYLREHEPNLRSEILTAVEALEVEADPRSAQLLDGLIRSAVLRARAVAGGRRVDEEPIRRLSWWSAGVTTAIVLLLLTDPLGLREEEAPDLLRPWTAVELPPPLAIQLLPGDTVLPRGAELHVAARLEGFDSEEVEVAFQSEEGTEWERWPMLIQDEEVGDHEFVLFRVEEPMDYFAEAAGVRSGTYRIDVVDLPYVARLELELHHPAYTRLPPEVIESAGDIFVLPDTRVVVRAEPTVPIPAGRIVLDEVGEVAMTLDAEARLTGEFVAQEPGFYRIDLEDDEGTTHRGSPDHLIDIVEDLPPIVSVERPARDVRVTSVEEVYVEAEASDDYAVATMELIFSVNGGPEDMIPLLSGSESRLSEVSAGHTFFLEDYDLQPGDLVSLSRPRARQRTAGRGAGGRVPTSSSSRSARSPRTSGRRNREAGVEGVEGAGVIRWPGNSPSARGRS